MAEDVIKGSVAVPKTLNWYGYCWRSPVNRVDYDGNTAIPVYKPVYDALSVLYDNIEGYLKDANGNYQRQLIENPPPVMPTNPTGLPDLTEEIDEWLFGKEQEFQEMVDMYNGGAQGIG